MTEFSFLCEVCLWSNLLIEATGYLKCPVGWFMLAL